MQGDLNGYAPRAATLLSSTSKCLRGAGLWPSKYYSSPSYW
jgi:hypothetical protein